jgi:CHASE3 domain sensor protein
VLFTLADACKKIVRHDYNSPEVRSMKKTVKAALLLGFALLLLLIVINSHIASRSVMRVGRIESQQNTVSLLQSDVARLMVDVRDVQSGQHGYVLTADNSYLDLYTSANQSLQHDFERTRADLTVGSPEERDHESRIEKAMAAKLAEAEQSIHWRQQGYRHRAFVMIESGLGKRYTDEASSQLVQLASSVAESDTQYRRDMQTALDRAARSTNSTSFLLLMLGLLLCTVAFAYLLRLEREAAAATLAWRTVHDSLERFQKTVSQDLRSMLSGAQQAAERLLQQYGDFLPVQGQQYAQRIREITGQMGGIVDGALEKS